MKISDFFNKIEDKCLYCNEIFTYTKFSEFCKKEDHFSTYCSLRVFVNNEKNYIWIDDENNIEIILDYDLIYTDLLENEFNSIEELKEYLIKFYSKIIENKVFI